MKFGIDDAKTVTVDLDELISSRMLIQANSGSGKSWLLRRILEQTHGHVPQIVIDPEGEFASLREKYDYVHAAPSGGDTVATPRSAALLATKLLELRVSAIVDIYELHPHERVRFVKLFLEALVNAPKSLWGETLVVVDEAHIFAPKQTVAESLSAMIGMASLGRKRGFAALYATQRIQKLHNDACAELNNKLIGRATLDVDVKRAAEELGFLKERWRDLKNLRPGHFFATGPAFNISDITEVHAGGVRTTHPKAGKTRISFVAPPPTAKIRALLPQLADLPAEAEKKVKTEEDLRKEITRLQQEVTRMTRESVGALDKKRPRAKDTATIRTLKKGLVEAMRIIVQITSEVSNDMSPDDLRAALDTAAKAIEAKVSRRFKTRALEIKRLQSRIDALQLLLDADVVIDVSLQKQEPFRVVESAQQDAVKAVQRLDRSANKSPNGLPKGQRQILTVLAQSPNGASSRSRLALLAGYSPSGGGFNNYLGQLRSSGSIEGSDLIRITNVGEHDLGEVEPLPKGEALVQFWSSKLGKAERAILDALVAAHPNSLSKEEVASQAGYEPNGGGFNNALGRLRTIELIEGRGEIKAAAALCE